MILSLVAVAWFLVAAAVAVLLGRSAKGADRAQALEAGARDERAATSIVLPAPGVAVELQPAS